MKTQLTKTVLALFAMIMTSYSYSQSYCDSNPVDIHGNLSVVGNKIVDQNNAPVSFAGNSFFWSNTNFNAERFYNASAVSWLKDDWGATIVRAAMGVEDAGGYIGDPEANKQRATTIVDAAIAEGLYVIIDWHSHNAENYQSQAVDFFREMARTYGNNPNVIYEVYNEPIGSSWSGAVKPYAEAVISAIRAIDPDNLIIVGSPTWSQDVDIASNDPITSSTNIAYTLHFYAGTHGASLRAKAQTALNNGIALMATEWGTVNADGNGNVNNNSTDEWMDFLAANDISHLNWSVNDKSEGASILRPGASSTGGWSNSNLTTSGLKVKSIIENWAEYCDGEPIVIDPPADDNYTSVPARIQAEDYTSQSGTQVENTLDSGGGQNVGFIDVNDSLSYNIDVPSSGNYTIDFRVASRSNGASFNIFSGNSNIGNVSSSSTGDWQAWETVSTSVSLNQGEQTIRLVATGSGWNINWLEFSEGGDNNNNNDENLALDGTASQVSTNHGGNASRAIDGNTNGSYTSGSVTHTSTRSNAWWQVALNSQSNINEIVIYNRTDNCCKARLRNFTVTISDANGNQTYSRTITSAPDPSVTINTGGVSGETVRITSNLTNTALSLAEVEVYGSTNSSPSQDSYTIRARGTSGSEQISLELNGTTVQTFNLTTSWANYSTTSSLGGNAIVAYINDTGNRDTEVDYLQKNGTTFQAENQATNTSVYQNGSCGGSFSQLMHCPGYIEFSNSSSAKSSSKNSSSADSITAYLNSYTKSLNINVNNITNYSNASIFDVQGRKILSQKLNQNSSEISLEGYKSGIYFLRLSGLKNYSQTFAVE